MSDDLEIDPSPAEDPGFNSYVNPDGSFQDGWQSHLTGEYAAAANTAAQYKSLPELAKAVYESKQRISSTDARPYVPGDNASEKDVANFRRALGLPDTVAEYKLERPEGVPEDGWDNDLATQYAQLFYEHNIPPKAAKALVAKQAEVEASRAQAWSVQQEQTQAAAMDQLHKEFGSGTTAQLDLARRMALTTPGITADDLANSPGFSDPAVIRALAFAGRNMGEDRIISSQDSGGAVSAKAEADRIIGDKSHPDFDKFWSEDPAVTAKVNALFAKAARAG